MTTPTQNADRIAVSVAKAEAAALEKATRRRAAAKAPPRPRKAAAAPPKIRMKIVWAVGKPGIAPTKTYPYIEREGADADAKRRGGEYRVAPLKIPME